MITGNVHDELIRYFSTRVSLNEAEINFIKNSYELKVISKKDFLFSQGEVCKTEAFVVEGSAKVFYSDEKGNEHILYFAFKDWWMGDIASFNFGEPAIMSAQALEDLQVLIINPERK